MIWKHIEDKIYSEDDNGELMTEADFTRMKNGIINIDHVYVKPHLRGQGMAENTMIAVVNYLRENNLKATATCSYANAWFKKNKLLYSDIIAD